MAQARLTRLRCIVAAAAACAGLCVSRAAADESTATAVLEGKGLRKAGLYWVLPGETELGKRLKEFGRYKKALRDAAGQRDELETKIQAGRQTIHDLYAQRMRLNGQLAQATSAHEHNKTVAQINELTDRINLLQQDITEAEQSHPAWAALAKARDAYARELLEIQDLAKQTESRYAALAADAEVRTALDDLSVSAEREFKLGPRPTFRRRAEQVAELESAVRTETIELQRHGSVFLVDAVINGAHRVSMIFDTGASIVLIPHELAARVGLTPTDSDPAIHLHMADGRAVEARLMTLASVQVGEAVAENVECAVLPAGTEDVQPLLGGTFLRHFVYQINPDTGTLALTRVETSAE